MISPICIPLQEIADQAVGGKAEGLARLLRDGFDVPEGFVVVGASSESLPEDLDAHYERLSGGKVAVRSSASGEDSIEASFAGQYETVLNVEGQEALRAAIADCLRSAEGMRAVAYRDERAGQTPVSMNVVVQKMVDARVAGVLFTVNPVNARRDQVVIDAVSGLGESLVSGHATPDHWLLSKGGRVVDQELQGVEPTLTDDAIETLLEEALQAEARYGAPLDMEWAIDQDGKLYWLQARPITRLPADPNELDTTPATDAVYTWANIGEMMPGAVTPLTYSVTGRGIDIGMQRWYRRIGSDVPEGDEMRYVAMFFGHLFLNLKTMAALAADVAGSTKTQMCLALCGRDIEELDEPKPASAIRRAANGVRYFGVLLSARRYGKALDALKASLSLPTAKNAREYYHAIDESLPAVWEAYELHLMSSASSGALSPILLGIVAKGEEPTAAHHAEVARMLAGATNVESADIAAGAERVLDRLLQHPHATTRFANADLASAGAWLQSQDSGEAGAEFARYIERHGHRAVRELELRQIEWAVDPTPVIISLQSGLRARLNRTTPARTVSQTDTAVGPSGKHPILERMRPLAHGAVRCREHTKSGLVAVTTHFKHAYRALGSHMAREGLLPDEDAVFFLTHEELGQLVHGRRALTEIAIARRKVIDYQMPLHFPQVFTDRPEPLKLAHITNEDGMLVGKPVSRGVVRGRARVVETLEQAASLEAGEILIVPITDVGWTPYFSLIAGLATDVGSAVSHGAVVAREYGLPAVVNLRVATSRFRTGDEVVLDGDRGTLALAEPE
ncbi:MAG: PEP-utilizing enzyme [Myxococcales bacterium]|nr:PEP-utilizing enzyme [Myxococcales bacterium]MDH3484352.1 PEP-utilizing enzyme [Myxococcales bacterium]